MTEVWQIVRKFALLGLPLLVVVAGVIVGIYEIIVHWRVSLPAFLLLFVVIKAVKILRRFFGASPADQV